MSIRVQQMDNKPYTFEEAIRYLNADEYQEDICYNVQIGKSCGNLMSKYTWLYLVRSGSFIDYDGMGDQIDANGNFILTLNSSFGWLLPSQAHHISDKCAYILWYNR